ncbi:MAG: acyl transferase [Flavobacteriaceae bacterium]|nr:acyl transferase [Flavobacteriaceae bacterium]MCY4268288.1 acyl transferase [Flavobacteriaceae bacterium]MCY4298514.1 acyl transferase [Flavobacteriaceae bacterium]
MSQNCLVKIGPKTISNSFDFFHCCLSKPQYFDEHALILFKHQYTNNLIYRRYCQQIGKSIKSVHKVDEIPFLPISFFRSHKVYSSNKPHEIVFESSRTTSEVPSKHFVQDVKIYEKSFLTGFENILGSVSDYAILALLPTYLERKNASIIYMVNALIRYSRNPDSSFYLKEYQTLASQLKKFNRQHKKNILFGLSSALLEFAQQYPLQLKNTIVMETGGTKGMSQEISKQELHDRLKKAFGLTSIHSEYGMTELLSQAYSVSDYILKTPPWMKIWIADVTDPFEILGYNKTGAIHVIDLANIDSCSFIATQDLGKLKSESTFELMGRFDHADIRGCNLLFN